MFLKNKHLTYTLKISSKLIIFLLLVLICNPVNAQVSKKAQKYFDEANYDIGLNQWETAKEKLKLAIKASPKFDKAHLFLANVHYQLHEYDAAIASYEYTIQQEQFPVKVYQYLAQCYFETQQFDQSLKTINHFLESSKISKQSKEEGEQLKANAIYSKKAIQQPLPFEPINLGENVNSVDDEYMPSLNADESVVMFTRKVFRQEDLFETGKTETGWKEAKVVEENVISTGHNEGAHCISANGKLLLYTICNKKPSLGSCDIYLSNLVNDHWSEPININKPINSTSWESQPTLSADGKSIYFVSNRPGGFGGKDIWVSHNINGIWQTPVNLGPEINTKFDEQTPFIHFDNETLYFSSDGHPGLGKQDIFFSKKVNGKFTEPVNFGYPINTNKNESGLSVSLNGLEAYYAAEKEGGFGGLDIYQFKTPIHAQPKRVTYVKATIFDENDKKTNAQFVLTDINSDETIINDYTNDGDLLIALPSGREYSLHVKKDKYLFKSYHFQLKDTVERNAYLIKLHLEPIQIGNSTVLNNVFFETDSYELTSNSNNELNTLVDLLNKNTSIHLEISGHTDNVGDDTYNLTLSQKRAESVVNYLISEGISPNRLKAKGYGSTMPNATNETIEGRFKNRRTEFKIIE